MSSTVARRKLFSRCAASSTGRRARRCSFWVAIPTGQLFVWHARMPRQPIAWIALFAIATASAPSASALAKSAASRRPPVTTSVHVAPLAPVEVTARPGECGDRRDRDVVAEEQRRRARTAAPAVEDDVVDADLERGVDVVLDVLRRQLHADRDPAAALAHLVGEAAEVVDAVPIGERRGRNGGRALGQPAHLGDPALHLRTGQVPARPRLGALAELEVEGLDLREHVPAPAEARRRELVEVARVLALFFGQHAALARADARSRELRSACEGGLRFLRQRAERHVGDEQRKVEPQRLGRVRADAHLGADGHVVEQREPRELRGDELDRVPTRHLLSRRRPSPRRSRDDRPWSGRSPRARGCA